MKSCSSKGGRLLDPVGTTGKVVGLSVSLPEMKGTGIGDMTGGGYSTLNMYDLLGDLCLLSMTVDGLCTQLWYQRHTLDGLC